LYIFLTFITPEVWSLLDLVQCQCHKNNNWKQDNFCNKQHVLRN